MDNYKIFSKELSICYFLQNEELSDLEITECYEEDSTIIMGELMSMLINDDDDMGELWGDEDE